jgi:hypothetical protein
MRDPIKRLHDAVMAIGDAYGTDADCASAAALLREAARLMGYELRARPVSVVIRDKKTGDIAVMGPKARARFSPEDLARSEDRRPDGEDNGHLILTSEDPQMLYDPNLRQTGAYGIHAPSVIMNIDSTQPPSGEWNANLPEQYVLYILDEGNRVLIDAMKRAAPNLAEAAQALVGNLRDGMSVDELASQSATWRAKRK